MTARTMQAGFGGVPDDLPADVRPAPLGCRLGGMPRQSQAEQAEQLELQ